MSLLKRGGAAVDELLRLDGEQRVGAASCTVEWAAPLPDRARWVRNLTTEPHRRGEGHASRLLTLLAAQADALGIALVLEPAAAGDSAMTDAELERMYRRRGYVTLQRAPTLLLVRPPQTHRVAEVAHG